MAFTAVVPWVVGNRLTQVVLNKMVTAIQELQDEVTTGRPQLRVYAPASVTNGQIVPYANVRVDTHGGWNPTTKQYTVAKAGMYLVSIQFKCSGTAVSPGQNFRVNGTGQLWTPGIPSGGFAGASLSGVLTLPVGAVCDVLENNATYTPQNDTAGTYGTGSNYFHLTYLGPQ